MSHEKEIQLGLQKVQAGKPAEAEAIFRHIVAAEPNHPEANVNIGNLLCMAEKFAESLEWYERALAGRPRYADAYINLGNAHKGLKDYKRAIAAYEKALAITPNNAIAVNNLGTALEGEWRMDEAMDCYRRALAIQPGYATAHFNLGTALELLGRMSAAIAEYRRAVELDPKSAMAFANLGSALVSDGQYDEALLASRKAIEVNPDLAKAHVNLGSALWLTGNVEEAAVSFRRASEMVPDDPVYPSNYLFSLHFHPGMEGAAIRREHAIWHARYIETLKGSIAPHANDRSINKRLRIGYVSPNFWAHSEAAFILPLLEHHDHEGFEIICYSDAQTSDEVTERLHKSADGWRPTRRLDAEQLAEKIREDGIDIVIDLTLHMRESRIMTFARKPAPVQVAYLAYPGTTGLAAMDYRLTDAYIDPPGVHEDYYTEQCVRLSPTFACFDPAGMHGEKSTQMPEPISKAPALRNGFVTFGSLNNFAKVNERILELWSRVLKARPYSRLRLLAPTEGGRRRVRGVLERLGVDVGRIDFVAMQLRPQYLAEYGEIDICLDTLPYNGHTTSLDSIWMGVPVVTRVGRTASGRVGWSVLNNLQLTELAAQTDEEFVRIAVDLAGDLARLSELRRTLRERLAASPIMDGARFAREVERAYRRMWVRWATGSDAAV